MMSLFIQCDQVKGETTCLSVPVTKIHNPIKENSLSEAGLINPWSAVDKAGLSVLRKTLKSGQRRTVRRLDSVMGQPRGLIMIDSIEASLARDLKERYLASRESALMYK